MQHWFLNKHENAKNKKKLPIDSIFNEIPVDDEQRIKAKEKKMPMHQVPGVITTL